ncbi:MAG: protease inhibitor I42 family protein [Terriglobia bacterium]
MAFPSNITLQGGEEGQLRLQGAGSVGYVWIHRVDGPPGVVSLHFESASAPPKPISGSLPQGGSVDQILVLRGLGAGRVTVHLELRRPWEHDRPPRMQYTVEVTVT